MRKKIDLPHVLTVSAAHLLHDIYSAFLAPILPLLINKLGMSVFQAGLLDFIRRIPSLMNPLIGLMADKISVRYFIIIAPAVTSVTMSLLGVAQHYILLVILLFVAGISSALFHVPAPVMIKHVSHDQIGKGMSYYMLGGELARTLGPLVILGAVSIWGLEGSYRLMPLGIIASIMLFFQLRKIKISKDFSQSKEPKASETFKKLTPFFISITGIIVFRSAMKAALTLYLPTYLTSQGASIWLAGISLSILQFSGAGGTFFAGIISDQIGRKNALLIITLINPLLMFLFLYVKGIWSIPILIITGFFLFGIGPVMLALIHDINSRHMSFINGVYMTISFAVSSIFVLLVGYFSDKIGLDTTFKISALAAFGSIPFVLSLKNKTIETNRE